MCRRAPLGDTIADVCWVPPSGLGRRPPAPPLCPGSILCRNAAQFIVAIDAYDYPNTLPSCINDGRAIAALLAGSGYTGNKLFDASAARANVLSGLDWLLAGAQPDDDLVFYYSGHGYQPNIGGNLQQSLVLIDGMLLDRDFTPRTALVPAGTLTVLLDACFSGGFDKFLIRSAAGKALVEQPKVKAYVPMAGDDVRLGLPPPVGAAPPSKACNSLAAEHRW